MVPPDAFMAWLVNSREGRVILAVSSPANGKEGKDKECFAKADWFHIPQFRPEWQDLFIARIIADLPQYAL